MDRAKLAGKIDHTLLKTNATLKQIQQLCREAAEHHFHSVCVNPVRVKMAAEYLKGMQVAVCSVIGFPSVANTTAIRADRDKVGALMRQPFARICSINKNLDRDPIR